MVLFKKIDAYTQIILIVAGLFLGLILRTPNSIMSYFVVGGWQILSAFIHFVGFSKMPFFKGRRGYLIALLLVAIAGILSVVLSELIIAFLIGLLFISPFMAVWYTAICFGEIKLWEQYRSSDIS